MLDAVNASGEAFLSHTKIRERYAIRMAIGHISSDRAEVDRAWRLLRDEASRLDGEMRQEWLSALRISRATIPTFATSWRMFLAIVRLSRQSDKADK